MANNDKVIKEQNMYQNIQERYEEMSDFIHYKNLDDEFRYFKEHAHEDKNSELPFPSLAL